MSQTYTAHFSDLSNDVQSETLDALSYNSKAIKAVQETSEFQSAAIKGLLQGDLKIFAVSEERDAVKLGSFKLSDIYGWAEVGKLPLIEYFKTLEKAAEELEFKYSESFEFEDSCTDFWSRVVELDSYFGCSIAHDMAITIFLVLASTGVNSFLTKPKIASIRAVLTHLGSRLNLDVDEIGMISDDLELAGFDLAVGMDFDLDLLGGED